MNQHLRTVPHSLLRIGLLAFAGCASPEENGRAEAERDIATGQLKIRTYGMPVPWMPDYTAMLHERLGIKVDVVAGCMVTKELVRNAEAYNKRMEAEIARRFGPDALAKISKEAEERFNRTRVR